MINKLKATFLKVFRSATGSLAFVPLMIMLAFAILGFSILSLKDYNIPDSIMPFLGWAITKDPGQASSIITTLLAGLITLTVFSFSMVMVVINQASTQFTPRVIHYITRNKENQFVLGFYIGTILYFIILLLNYTREDDEYIVPALAFSLAILAGITCLLLFVRFIHTISVSVQVNNIILLIYRTVKHRLNQLYEETQSTDVEKVESVIKENEWHSYNAKESGYIQDILRGASQTLKEHDAILKLDLPSGEYVLEGNPLYYLNKKVDAECEDELAAFFNFEVVTNAKEHSHYAFIQLTEIACKALSPGINDPGTARMCIDYLTDILYLRSKLPDNEIRFDNDNGIRVILAHYTYSDIIKSSFTPIRHYGKTDVQILKKLLSSLYSLAQHDLKDTKFKHIYIQNAEAILESAKEGLYNPADKENLNLTILQLNNLESYFSLPTL